MILINTIYLLVSLVVLLAPTTSAFWLNWGAQETPNPPQYYYYQQRLLQPSYPINGKEPVPTIPMQVPLQAQLTPATTVQNVQLVPCLCPVTQDFDIDKTATVQESFFNQQKH